MVTVETKEPLGRKELNKFKILIKHYKDDIIKKGLDFFILNKEVKSEIINKKIK